MEKRTAQVIASVAAVAIAVVSSLTCFIGAAQLVNAAPHMAMAQHACCAGTNRDCQAAASAQRKDCCTTMAVSTTPIQSERAIPPVTVAVVAFVFVPATLSLSRTVGEPLKSSSPPTHLLDAVFRI